jgi:hypothetical protein
VYRHDRRRRFKIFKGAHLGPGLSMNGVKPSFFIPPFQKSKIYQVFLIIYHNQQQQLQHHPLT